MPDATALAGASILVVEDDATLRAAVVRLLAWTGAVVREAANGDQAIASAEAAHVDLLLTDMEMPGRDGAAVAIAVAALHPRAAIVFMSGKPHAAHISSGRLAAGDRLVEKPFLPHLLVDALVTALAAARA